MLINEFKENQPLELPLLVFQLKEGVTANGAPYVSVTFQDKSGTIEGKLWDVKEHQKEILKQGQVVMVKFISQKYQGNMQLRINDVSGIDQSTININDYLPTGNINVEELRMEISKAINSITNKNIQAITKSLLKDIESEFFEYPAAMKNHHEFVSGLATHVVGMLKVGYAMCELYPLLNRDLLIAGIILHDMGKVEELSSAIVPEYTKEGKLIGHISIMHARVKNKAEQLGLVGEEDLLLRHMILSHHGEYEYGSPVLPMIPEAEVLHLIDNMDARMEMMRKALDTVEPGNFTARIFSLENRSIYKTNIE